MRRKATTIEVKRTAINYILEEASRLETAAAGGGRMGVFPVLRELNRE